MKVNVWMILFFAVVVVILVRECSRPDTDSTIIINDTLVMGDEVPYFIDFPAYALKPVKVIIPPDTFFTDVDSAAILEKCMEIARNYYTINYFDKTLVDDSSAFIRLLAHTFENMLYIDSLELQNHRPYLIRQTEQHYEKTKPRFYVGAGNGFNKTDIDFTADAMLTFPNRMAVAYKRGFITDFNYFTVYYSFGKRKR